MKALAVILPTYNSALYLNKCIDSLLAQSFTDFDLYIIDDGSTDATDAIVFSYNEPRIFYLKNPSNLGISKSLNKALKIVENKYEFIARMDADDWCFPSRFEDQLAYLDANPNIQMCGTQGYWLKDMDSVSKSNWTYPTQHNIIKLNLLFSACFGHSSVMYRNGFFSAVGYYNESIKTCEDWELWTRAIGKVELGNLPDFLMKYRITENSNHRDRNKKGTHLLERAGIISDYWRTFELNLSKEEVFDYYYSFNELEVNEFKENLKVLIIVLNTLYVKEIENLNEIWKSHFRYRFLRFILDYWKRSGVSRKNFSIWILLFTQIRFANIYKIFKSLYR
jgi:glycosyltransferase involved in cell wall biosynthesis